MPFGKKRLKMQTVMPKQAFKLSEQVGKQLFHPYPPPNILIQHTSKRNEACGLSPSLPDRFCFEHKQALHLDGHRAWRGNPVNSQIFAISNPFASMFQVENVYCDRLR
jgi:hypothetical protein